MKQHFIMISLRSDGSIAETKSYTKSEMINLLLQARRIRNGFFSISADDFGDRLLVKRAVESVGGIRQLAHMVGVSRETLYNWVTRGVVPAGRRDALRDLLSHEVGECED